MIKKLILLVVLFSLLLLATVWFAPASLLGSYLNEKQSPLELGMLKGSLRNGRAEQVRLNGINLGVLAWQFKQAQISPPGINVDIQADGPQLRTRAHIKLNKERISSTQLQGYFPASWLDLQTLAPMLFANGRINFDFSQLDLQVNQLPQATAVLDWKNASLSGVISARLGDIHFDVQNQMDNSGQQLMVKFYNTGATDLDLDGHISSDGVHYQLETLTASGRKDIRRFLNSAGRLQDDGRYLIQFKGLLKPAK